MKTLSKKYGKTKWIHTPLANHHRKRLANTRWLAGTMAASVIGAGQMQLRSVIHSTANTTEKRAAAIQICVEAMVNSVKVFNHAMNGTKDVQQDSF